MTLQGRKTGRLRRPVFGSILAVLLVGVLLYRVDMRALLKAIHTLPPSCMVVTILIIYASIPLRAVQWWLLLPEPFEPRFADVGRSLCLGYLGAVVFPMGGGEVLKSIALSRSSKMPLASVLASVALIRVQDLTPILGLGLLSVGILARSGVVLPESQQQTLLFSVEVVAAVVLAAMIGLFLLVTRGEQLAAAAKTAILRVPLLPSTRIVKVLGAFVGSFTGLSRKRFCGAQALSFTCWTLFALAPISLLIGFGVDFPAAIFSAVAITGIVTAAQVVPITPGGIGVYHVLCVMVLQAAVPGISSEKSLAYALVSHLLGTLAPALAGLVVAPSAWNKFFPARQANVC